MKMPFILFSLCASTLFAAERHQSFDADPNWDAHNNRPKSKPVTIEQNFGWESVDAKERVGGFATPAGEKAYYGKKIPQFTLNDKFSASGTMAVAKGGSNTLVGFFNPATANEWRTANTIVWRINGRGDTFQVHTECTTAKWRASAGVIGRVDTKLDRLFPTEMESGDKFYPWSLEYDPEGNGGKGTLKASFAGNTANFNLSEGHKADGGVFDHFGILNVMKSRDGGGSLWIADLVINGEKQDLSTDPKWDAHNNRATYETYDVRAWFDLGFSLTQFAGGKAQGEIGGRFFRGDCRYPEKLGYYGDKISTLTLDKPIKASGRVTLRRGVSDSTTLFGFFHHVNSIKVNPSQSQGLPMNVLGFHIEGPSAEGFYVYPVARNQEGHASVGNPRASLRIYPDGAAHDWTLEYNPDGAGGRGTLKVTLDGQATTAELEEGLKAAKPEFDRFGFVTPWIDGNEQMVYLDDLTYTSSHD